MNEVKPELDGQHVHIAYKRDAPHEKQNNGKDSTKGHCGTKDDWESSWAEQLAKLQRRIERNNTLGSKRATGTSGTHSIHRFIEVGLVADRRFLDFHNNTNYEQYLLTIMNMVSDYYHDSSSGNQIDVVVVRIIYLEKEKEEIDLLISPAAEDTLDSFAKWAEKVNPKDHKHPNHYDIAVLVTRYDICSEGTNCDLMGLAFVATACDPSKAACINEDSGLLLGVVIAHEVGHVMGCSHDTEEISGCKKEDKDGSFFIMSPVVFIFTIRWSTCSRRFITSYLESGLGDCLNDDPRSPGAKYSYPNMLPGAMYGSEFQCQMEFPGSKTCQSSKFSDCSALWCLTNTSCYSLGTPKADGTKCGENKWCVHKKCVDIGSRPAAVNGGWGAWGPMSSCSRTCGGGVKYSERECDKPVPANGGRYCIGERKKFSTCNTTPCDPSKPPFRAVQCSLYNERSVLTDGLHQWTPYLYEKQNPCALYCINEKNTFTKLSPTVNDSTPCKGGTNYMCLSGVCRKVGCNWVIDSDAIEDKCGICNGDGTKCTITEGDFDEPSAQSAYIKIVTVPRGARSIMLMEKKPAQNIFAVKLSKDSKYCLNDKNREERSGDYECAGTMIIYSHPEPDKEEIAMKGPIDQDIDLEYVFFYPKVNPGIHYSYSSGVVDTNVTVSPKYMWDFVEWTECSANCGGGSMVSEPTCVEENNGKVSPTFCDGIPHPEPKSRVCNQEPCVAKWRVSQWSKCSACDGNKGTRHRKIQCVRMSGQPDEEAIQANFDACKGRVPRQTEDCVGTRPCKKTCDKKTRESGRNELIEDDERDENLTDDDRRKMIDRFVDLGLARYLENIRASTKIIGKSYDKNESNDFRRFLRDWVMNSEEEEEEEAEEKEKLREKMIEIENKRKRTCELSTVETNFTTPKPGSIIKDSIPEENVILMNAPYNEESLLSNLSDKAYQEAGDLVGMSIDTKHKKTYKGAEAVRLIEELVNNKQPKNNMSEKLAIQRSENKSDLTL
ncbi:A disintegrin and metalloproteinase with thrombospondin motifs 12-like isoform X1 [Vespa crabro]|nr:A disintegrin and metalloproteinase with thrombospondin motifs 12-like isoform X1 [Vespa crabro]XP_046835692.1 A disintegrin and metalloproteinase with thrombospondin motifs 12-like isoform X1 [Vespa crabro]